MYHEYLHRELTDKRVCSMFLPIFVDKIFVTFHASEMVGAE